MADTLEHIDKLSSASISDEVLMDPSSSSIVTYVKPGLIEKKVFRHKDKVGNLWKDIHKVVVNEKQKVIFVEKRYKNHRYIATHRRRWSDGNASQWLMQQMEAKQTEKK